MQEISKALGLDCHFKIDGDENLPSKYAVSELAAWSFGAVGCAIAALQQRLGLVGAETTIDVDRRLAALWYGFSVHPMGWELPPVWDAVAGDYQTKDGWIRLHTNLPHHREAAMSVLGCNADKDAVAEAVVSWGKDQLENAIVDAGGVSAAMRSREEWLAHPQGKSVANEPLIHWEKAKPKKIREWKGSVERPLAGLRVLDLTRVLAGPVSTRTLAGFGAEILRIDPPGWDEANIVPDITLGKKCACLDLENENDRKTFEGVLRQADIFVHGYRPGALEGLGYGGAERSALSPNLIEVSLNAYGWEGPWRERRGFDSLVQMSCGIADAGRAWAGKAMPTPLPVQALDHATGYLMAAAAIRALEEGLAGKGSRNARLSLARTAELLTAYPQDNINGMSTDLLSCDFVDMVEQTPWGPARRLVPALSVANTPMKWRLAASELGSAKARWK